MIGPAIIERIARVLPYEKFDQLYNWRLEHYRNRAGIAEQTAQAMVEGLADIELLNRELALIERHAIRWVSIDSPAYPITLKNTHLPPSVLYWQGADLAVLDNALAMVGSRKVNLYGQRVIDMLVPDLVAAGWALVSGGAIGADTLVHQVTVRSGGITAAVIGSGLLKPYPSSNRRLFATLVEKGGIVMSPFPLTMEAMPGNFPARNRIIAGLSQATVVVQAAEKSGALITAMYALEQGREVCAVPGALDDPLSAGCHALLREGGLLIRSAQDILMALGDQGIAAQPVVEHEQQELPEEPKDPVITACVQPQLFDDLCRILQYDEMRLQDRLMALQLEGVLEQDIMGRWYSII